MRNRPAVSDRRDKVIALKEAAMALDGAPVERARTRFWQLGGGLGTATVFGTSMGAMTGTGTGGAAAAPAATATGVVAIVAVGIAVFYWITRRRRRCHWHECTL